MSGQVSTPDETGTGVSMIPREWQRFAAFLRSPSLPERAAPFSVGSARAVGWMFSLDLLLMTAIIGAAILIFSFGYELPSNKLSDLELGLPIVLTIVVAAPLFEEIGFRGWLSGRPAHVWPLVIVGAAVLAAFLAGQGQPFVIAGLILVAVAAATFAAWQLRGRVPLGFFARYFGWFYLFSTLAFAAVHLTNYDDANPAFLLLVIPQASRRPVVRLHPRAIRPVGQHIAARAA